MYDSYNCFNLFIFPKGVTLMDINEEHGHDVATSLKNEYGSEKVVFFKGNVTNSSEFEGIAYCI